MLERLGYTVHSYTESTVAFEVFRLQPDQFDLVITDQTMPKLQGDELSKKILEIAPKTPIIICTGYSSHLDEIQAKALGIKAFVTKPAKLHILAKTIREVLDGQQKTAL